MTEREFDLGADEFGQVKLVPVERDIHGLILQRDPLEGFIIGDYRSRSYLRINLLSWNDDSVEIATALFDGQKKFNTQFHDLKPEWVYQLSGTNVYLKPIINYVGIYTRSGNFFFQWRVFIIDAPEGVPVVRIELLEDEDR